MTSTKRCPRCGQVKAAEEFYRRRGGRRLSPYCRPCSRAVSRVTRRCRRQDPATAEGLRAVDRARQRRRRAFGRQDGEDR
jgi:adenine-specific DNA methylase